MKVKWAICWVAAMVFLAGCASTDVRQLRQERDGLAAELSFRENRIADLEKQNQVLSDELAYQKEVGETLQREKTARIKESSIVRRDARAFVQEQMRAIRKFSENKDLLDYVGGEPIDRPGTGGDNLLLVDMKNRIPAAGTLVGSKVFAETRADLSFSVLRPQGNNLAVLWVSKPVSIPGSGLSRITFDVPVAVEEGDLIGLFCPGEVPVPFDSGTGDTRAFTSPATVGQVIPVDTLEDRGKRTYSFGVVGFLD